MVLLQFFLTLAALVGIVVLAATSALWFDRAAVRVIRLLSLPVYRTAVMIAISIVQRPDEWEFCTEFRTQLLRHKIIGSIAIGDDAKGIRVETTVGTWKPRYIERRIICEAVDWRIDTYIRNSLHKAMLQHTLRNNLTGKIHDVT